MKKRFKKFMKTVNLDRENQICYPDELKVCKELIKKGWIKRMEYDLSDCFLIFLSKKGLKKAIKLNKTG